jgi:dienelactone hydrolase
LTYFRQRPDVDPKRIGIVGISCGATVAGMVASRNKVAALVLISGFYDFKEMVQKWQTAKWKLPPGIKKELEHNIAMDGGIENSTALRSLLPHISHLTMPILMIAGGQDRIIDVGQSETLHRLLDGQGTPNIFILDGTANHHIPLKDWRKPEKDFLDARLSDSFRSPKH